MEDQSLEPATVWCGNLEDLDAGSLRGWCNLVSAGFPCQPWSVAGKQKGITDERWIWDGIREVIGDVGPGFVFLENVPGLVSGGGLAAVLGDLAEMGFAAEWGCLTAESVGASHRRERVFILAHRDLSSDDLQPGSTGAGISDTEGCDRELADTGHERSDIQQWEVRTEHSGGSSELGNTNKQGLERGAGGRVSGSLSGSGCPEIRPCQFCGYEFDHELYGKYGCANCEGVGQKADPQQPGSQGGGGPGFEGQDDGPTGRSGGISLFAPGRFDHRWKAIISESIWLSPAIEPGIRVLVDGQSLVVDSERADQLRCSGNGVVAVQGAAMFVELFQRLNRFRGNIENT
jgi:DNA (cytosine-5)-methyltransferase 1